MRMPASGRHYRTECWSHFARGSVMGHNPRRKAAAMTTFAASIDQTLERELPAAASGCQHAYGRIVLACQNTVTAIALAITRDRQASEDIAQEAFVKGWQQLHQLRSSTSFLPWLRQITRNLARDWLRAQRGRPLTGEAAEVAMGMAADPSPAQPIACSGWRKKSPPRTSSPPCPPTAAKSCCCTTAKASARSRWPTCSGSATRRCASACRAPARWCATACCSASVNSPAAARRAPPSPPPWCQ